MGSAIPHLEQKHEIYRPGFGPSDVQSSKDLIQKTFGRGRRLHIAFNRDVFKELASRWIFIKNIPLSGIEGSEFRAICQYLAMVV